MILIDTSVLIPLFKDKTGETSRRLRLLLNNRDFYLSRFTSMELLQGARDETEWNLLSGYLSGQDYLEMDLETWENAARIYFELRRKGLTVRSTIDCCIAELAVQNDATLIHDDRDFLTVAKIRPLSSCPVCKSLPGRLSRQASNPDQRRLNF